MPIANTNAYIADGDHVVVVTRKGDRFLIDTSSVAAAKRYCWSKQENGYPRAVTRRADGKLKTIYLHRLICETSDQKPHVDHINGDPLDCRRSNLRACNRNENLSNQKLRSDNRTGFKGVGLHKPSGKFRARVRTHGRLHDLGLFNDPITAAAAAKAARERLHGEFARHV